MKHCLTIILLLIASIAFANKPITKTPPRLAVIISIDGLDNYEIEAFSRMLEPNGMKRLISGVYNPNATCSYVVTGATTDYASMMTGSTPHYHGIIADYFYSLVDDNIVSCIDDARYEGINTSKTVSPRLLQATTLADQIKLNNPKSKVYAIGLTAETATMLGGHLADGAIWFDNANASVCTSTYYDKGLPLWAQKINKENLLRSSCANNWQSLFSLASYQYEPHGSYLFNNSNPTFLQFNDKDDNYDFMNKFRKSPFINDIIKELATRAIRDEQLGTDDATDLLCVEFNAHSTFDTHMLCAENEDLILRLDRNIKTLLDIIEISVGLDNAVIVLTAPHNNANQIVKENELIPSGSFNSRRAMALLNSYLMAIYGQGRWISGYYDKNICLNKSLIEDEGIKIVEIQNYVAQFMLEFSGVHTAIPAHQIQTAASLPNDIPSRMRNSHFKNRSGDVVFTLLPGWTEYDERLQRTLYPSILQPYTPIAIWTKDIKMTQSNIAIEDLCPTLCRILHIPYPNACIGNTYQIKF
ncbi:MAG: alkaline phosphatase family protein [Paludibacteraceae bacterium]|nr:alkaline phosphatase family protein [Paludibacteraceae bacterium]